MVTMKNDSPDLTALDNVLLDTVDHKNMVPLRNLHLRITPGDHDIRGMTVKVDQTYVATKLFGNGGNVGAVGQHTDGTFLVFLKKRRMNYAFIDKAFQVSKVRYMSFTLKGGVQAQNDVLTSIMTTFLNLSPAVITNYMLENTTFDDDDIVDKLQAEFSAMTVEEAHDEVMRAKANPRTIREKTIVKIGYDLIAQKKRRFGDAGVHASMVRELGKAKVPDFNDLTSLPTQRLWTMDIDTMEIINMSLMDWMVNPKNGFLAYVLVIMGKPKLGKSPAAEAICAKLAEGLQPDGSTDTVYWVKTRTLDALRKVQDLLTENVPVLMDDMSPDDARGSRNSMGAHELKDITEVRQETGCHGRQNDIVLPFRTPRIVTTHKENPTQWFSAFPDVRSMSPEQRKSKCSADVLALFKRIVFCHVQEPLIPLPIRQAYDHTPEDEQLSRKMARLLA